MAAKAMKAARLTMVYVLTIEAFNEQRVYHADRMLAFFHADVEAMTTVAFAAVAEGELNLAVDYNGGKVNVRRVLWGGVVPGNGEVVKIVPDRTAFLEYRTM